MIAALCILNKDDFEINIIMNRLIHLLYIEIHLTEAATNPWIRFESDDSFIKFEVWINSFDLVQYYSNLTKKYKHHCRLFEFFIT